MADKYVNLSDIIETLEHEWGYEGMREDLEKLPTADVVEIVRCKDCRNFGEDVGMSKDGVWARCFLHQRIMCEKDYCSYGTPKERSEE